MVAIADGADMLASGAILTLFTLAKGVVKTDAGPVWGLCSATLASNGPRNLDESFGRGLAPGLAFAFAWCAAFSSAFACLGRPVWPRHFALGWREWQGHELKTDMIAFKGGLKLCVERQRIAWAWTWPDVLLNEVAPAQPISFHDLADGALHVIGLSLSPFYGMHRKLPWSH